MDTVNDHADECGAHSNQPDVGGTGGEAWGFRSTVSYGWEQAPTEVPSD